MKKTFLVVREPGHVWTATCADHDMVTQAETLDALHDELHRQLAAHMVVCRAEGIEPFTTAPPTAAVLQEATGSAQATWLIDTDRLIYTHDPEHHPGKHLPERRTIKNGEPEFNAALLDGVVRAYLSASDKSFGTSPVFAVERTVCASCGHQHTTAQLGGICVGCPCEERS